MDNYTEALNRINDALESGAETLSLHNLKLTELPPEIGLLTRLTSLDLSINFLSELPPSISLLTQLTDLNLLSNEFTELPSSIGSLAQLTKLNLMANWLNELPSSIGMLTQLTELNLMGNQLSALPSSIGLLTELTNLNLGRNIFKEFPSVVGSLTQLTTLVLYDNKFRELPMSIGSLTQLTDLNLGANELTELPASISALTQLTDLELCFNQLSELPLPIRSLTQLRDLNLKGNKLTELPSSINSLIKLTTLDLSDNKLTDLPSSIGSLTQLATLKLGQNRFSQLPSSISSLIQLSELDLERNGLSKLPSWIGSLTQLTDLNLSGNELTELPSSFNSLVKLTTLDLSENQFTELPSLISSLTQLTTLKLGHNRFSELPSWIGLLVQLADLNLVENQLSQLPSSIGSLTQLTNLRLGGNQLRELPSSIRSLAQLTGLDLGGNQFSELPSWIGSLTQLTHLNLGFNHLSELPSSIGSLTQLRELILWENELRELPPSIGLLTQLTELDMSRNRLSELPTSVGLLPHLKSLAFPRNQISQLNVIKPLIIKNQLKDVRAFNNPILDVPRELLGEYEYDNNAIPLAEYWQALENDQDSMINQHAKCLLVGNALVGKTTLTHTLVHGQPPAEPIEVKDRTHGIVIEAFELHSDDQAGENQETVTVQLWDMGGQELYHATHRLFLQQNAPYILVWSEDVESDCSGGFHPIPYWYDMIRQSAGDSPVILVKNKIDLANHKANPPESNSAMRFTQKLEVSAQQGTHLAALKGQLQDLYFKQYRESWCYPIPGSWQRLRKALDKLRLEHKTLSFEDYDRLCLKLKVQYQDTALLYLHNSGHVFYQSGLFRNQIILDQSWLLQKVYSLFEPLPEPGSNRRVIEEEQHGYFKGYQTSQFWPEHADEEERRLLISYMRSCYMLVDVSKQWKTDFKEREYLVPALLPKTPSTLVRTLIQNQMNCCQLVLRYPFLHQGHFERLMKSLLSKMKMSREHIWRSGMLLNHPDDPSWILLEMAPDYFKDQQGHAYSLGLTFPQPIGKITWLDNVLSIIDRTLRFSQAEILMSLDAQQFVLLEAIKAALNNRQTQVACTDSRIVNINEYLPITTALQNLLGKHARENLMKAKTIQLFLSYAHNDQTLATELHERLQKKFKVAKGIQIEIWHDGQIPLGDDWHANIQTALDNCDYGLLMVSEDFLISDYIGEHELPNLMEHNKALPVCLKRIDFEHYDLKGLEKHQFFTFEGNSFSQCEGEQDKEDFMHALFRAIINRLGVDGQI